MKGRKPKPRSLRLVNGNPSKRPLHEEPQPGGKGAPAPPAWLSPAAREAWDYVVPLLEDANLLTRVDAAALTCLCTAIADHKAAQAWLDKLGPVLVYERKSGTLFFANPAAKVVNAARAQILKICAEYALTPVSRARLAGPHVDRPSDEFDRFRIAN